MDDWRLNKSGVPSVNRDQRFTSVPRGTERIRLMDSNAFQLHLATSPLIDDILRDGARRALQSAIEDVEGLSHLGIKSCAVESKVQTDHFQNLPLFPSDPGTLPAKLPHSTRPADFADVGDSKRG